MQSLRAGIGQATTPVGNSARGLLAYSGATASAEGYYRLSDAIWLSLLRNPGPVRRRQTLSLREVAFSPQRAEPSPNARVLAYRADINGDPISVEQLILHLQAVVLRADVVTPAGFPLGGKGELILRGDGSYDFRGEMRATGFTSYEYVLQVFVECRGGIVVLLQQSGRVYGTDTPGARQRNWDERGVRRIMRLFWPELRAAGTLRYRLDANIVGVTATAGDVLLFAVKSFLAYAARGPVGLIVVAGNELSTRASASTTANAGWLADLSLVGTTLLLVGSEFALPVLVAGAAVGVVTAATVNSRRMNEDEIRFAQRVFGSALPYRRIVLTDMTGLNGRKFVYPATDGSLLVNLGDAFADPIGYESKGAAYLQRGEAFIHELTHAWQLAQNPVKRFLPLWICEGATSSEYHYFDGVDRIESDFNAGRIDRDMAQQQLSAARRADKDWPKRSWSGDFNIEQQASIVDDWYGEHATDPSGEGLSAPAALNDPAFRFISNNIRAGRD